MKDRFGIEFSFLSMGAITFLGFVLCLLFLPSEKISKKGSGGSLVKPVKYLEIIKDRPIFSLVLFRTCFTTSIGVIWAFLPLLASTKLGLSSSAIGIVVMISVLVSGLLQAPMGVLADRVSKKLLIVAGGLLAAVSMAYLNQASSFSELFLVNFIFGLAGGISFPAVMALGVIEGRRVGAMGSLMGLLALAHSLGMLIGPLLAGVLLQYFSFALIFNVGAVILIAGTFFFFKVY